MDVRPTSFVTTTFPSNGGRRAPFVIARHHIVKTESRQPAYGTTHSESNVAFDDHGSQNRTTQRRSRIRSRKIPSSNYRETRADPSPGTDRVQYLHRPGHLACAQGQSQSTVKIYTGPSSQRQRITWYECAQRDQREKILESEMGWIWESWEGDVRCRGRQAEEANDCVLRADAR